ncbi:MAG TPA: hypothetical protein VHE81_03815 [Lacipirellulaceae bacterium]|nr:hypothetical protein [Lacipirellulaceae bacterium]
MGLESWGIERWRGLFEIVGPIAALFFTALALHIDARVRRAETIIEITKQHRELWMYFYERPSLSRLLDKDRDLTVHPLADEEVHFVNFLVNHLRASFYARIAGIFAQPECVSEDIRSFFAHPAARAAWEVQKRSHEPKFVAFIEANMAPA